MGLTVIIAEKHLMAVDISKAIGATEKHDGYYRNSKGTCVTWAIGHLADLAEPERYGWGKWTMDTLPMIPDKFILELSGDADKKRQFKVISDLMRQADRIIEATDPGREGELIFRYIYTMTGCTKPFERLWVSSLLEDSIMEGLKNLKKGTDYDRLYMAGKARGEADWMIGMNLTRAMTLKYNRSKVYSIGRVQTPTLGLIVSRYREHTSFVPKPFYVPVLELKAGETVFKARYYDKFFSTEQAEMELFKVDNTVRCVSAKVKQTKENPPKLYDLTLLQRECNRFHKFSADHTLSIAQSLYEKKMISYPRTDSNYLPEEFLDVLPNYFGFVGERFGSLKKVCESLRKGAVSELYIDSSKVGDHHAIIPLINPMADISRLTPDENIVYSLLAYRFVCAFMPPCERREQELLFLDVKEYYKTIRKHILKPGWRELQQDSEEEQAGMLLNVDEGDLLPLVSKSIEEGMTKKPPLLTEDSLLGLMITAGKLIEDENLLQQMKSVGLGTVATRHAIIELLFKRGYIERQKQNLVPTAKGEELYDIVHDMDVSKVDLTAEWERRLADIEKGNLSYDEFMCDLKKYTQESVGQVKGLNVPEENLAGGMKCPICGKSLRMLPSGLGCSGWVKEDENSCKFFLSRTVLGAKLTDKDLNNLIEGKPSSKSYKFTSKKGKSFEAKVRLVDGKIDFMFEADKK